MTAVCRVSCPVAFIDGGMFVLLHDRIEIGERERI